MFIRYWSLYLKQICLVSMLMLSGCADIQPTWTYIATPEIVVAVPTNTPMSVATNVLPTFTPTPTPSQPLVATATTPSRLATRRPEGTQIPTATPLPLPSLSVTESNRLNPWVDYPLAKGNQWVYQREDWSGNTINSDVTFTTTSRITETVLFTYIQNSDFVAGIKREVTVMTGVHGGLMLSLDESPEFRWVINFDELEARLRAKHLFTYKSPYLNYTQRHNSCSELDYQRGCTNVFVDLKIKTPAGNFSNCYIVAEPGHAGPFVTEFCSGIGVVGKWYDHNGTRYGYRSVLVDYLIHR